MQSKVQKWGNSLALRIPKSFATEIGLADESTVELSLIEGKLVITPLPLLHYSLDVLLANVTTDNIHSEQDFGIAEGNEVW